MTREALAKMIFIRLRENDYSMGYPQRYGRLRAHEHQEVWNRLKPEERNVFLFLARDILDQVGGTK